MSEGGLRTAVYLRLSRDSARDGLGVERQLESCRHLAAAKGWTIDPDWLLSENDTPASGVKTRPKFEALLRGMERGDVHAVLAYQVDRLVRRMADAVRLWDVAKQRGVLIATVSGELDLTTASGRSNALLWSTIAQIEIEHLTERLQDKAQQSLQAGRNANAGSRPFGWDVTRTKHREDEAPIIRVLADRLIGGESLSSVVRDLNKRGVPTAGYADRLAKAEKQLDFDPGRPIRWDVRKLRGVLSNQRHAGRVEHHGVVVCDDKTGAPVKAQWQPILEPDTFDRLQAALENRRHVSDVWTGERRHLLSGTLLRCGVCGQKVLPFQQTSKKHAYRCRGHLTRDRDRADEYVLAMVRQRIEDHPFSLDSLKIESARAAERSTRIEEIDRQLADLDDNFLASGGSSARLGRLTAALEVELEALRGERIEELNVVTGAEWVPLAPNLLESSGSLLPNDDPSKADVISAQRWAIGLYVRQIQVFPTKVRGNRFDTDSIKIHWRDPAKFSASGRWNKDTGEATFDVHVGPDKAPAP